MGHGAATFNYSVNCFASILHFSKTYSVTANAPVPLHLRFTGAAGIMLGILFAGWRLVPAAGMRHCLPKAYVCAVNSLLLLSRSCLYASYCLRRNSLICLPITANHSCEVSALAIRVVAGHLQVVQCMSATGAAGQESQHLTMHTIQMLHTRFQHSHKHGGATQLLICSLTQLLLTARYRCADCKDESIQKLRSYYSQCFDCQCGVQFGPWRRCNDLHQCTLLTH